MAKAKKKESLTPEERLQAALVSESEQPYPVPANWCWVHLLDSFYNCTDSKKKIPQKEYIEDGKIAVVDQGQNLVGGYTNDRKMAFSGNLPVIIFGDHTRCIKYIDFPFAQGADGVKVLKPKPFFDAKAFYYAFQNINIPNLGYRRHFPLFDQYTIPLPPFAEQQRIVDRIESLFAKLDEAKQKAQDALDSFETRKAAILHKAFTGELTAQWRKKHSIGMESWETKKLSEVSTLQTGLMKGKNYSGKTVMLPYLRVANVQDGFLNLSEIKEIEVSEELIDRYSLKNGDVLFTEGGDYDKLGRGTVWQGQIKNCLHQNHVFVVRPQADVLSPYFLSYQAGSRYGKQYFLKCSKQTTNLASINSTQLKGFPVLMPTIEEQAQIVLLIDDLLAKEQQAKEAAEGVLEQIDLMKKAILARAFRGELGTNDPREESAVELLKQVL